MVETPHGPKGHEGHAKPGPPARRGARHEEEESGEFELSPEGEETLDWDLPEWVGELAESDLEGSEAADPAEDDYPDIQSFVLDDQELEGPEAQRRAAGELAEELTRGFGHLSPEAADLVGGGEPALLDEDAWGLDAAVESGVSWLMDLEEGDGEALDEADGESRFAPAQVEAPALIAPIRRRRRVRRLTAVLLFILAIAVAGLGGRELHERRSRGTEVAHAPAQTPPVHRPAAATPESRSGAAPDAAAEAPVGAAAESEAALATGEFELGSEAESELTASEPAARGGERNPFLALTSTRGAPDLFFTLPFLAVHFGASAEGPAIAASGGDGTSAGEGAFEPGRESREQVVTPSDLVLLPAAVSPFREARADDLAGMWTGTAIPTDAIDGPRVLVTPRVGQVRVLLHGGEVFDGTLYAVGESRVWLDLGRGRLAILSWQVARIEHILTGPGSPGLGEAGSQHYAGLERVRVRTPGGVFYGRLLSRDGDEVVLITAEGARVTLKNARVEPAGSSRTRIVDASAVAAEEESEGETASTLRQPASGARPRSTPAPGGARNRPRE